MHNDHVSPPAGHQCTVHCNVQHAPAHTHTVRCICFWTVHTLTVDLTRGHRYVLEVYTFSFNISAIEEYFINRVGITVIFHSNHILSDHCATVCALWYICLVFSYVHLVASLLSQNCPVLRLHLSVFCLEKDDIQVIINQQLKSQTEQQPRSKRSAGGRLSFFRKPLKASPSVSCIPETTTVPNHSPWRNWLKVAK